MLKSQFFSKLFLISYLAWIFLQIRDDLPLGVGVNPTKFGVNRHHFSFLQKLLNSREITIFATKAVQFFANWGRLPLQSLKKINFDRHFLPP
jgi:hypothetical protein